MELLEREDLIRELERYWFGAKSGSGALIFVAGESGAGKSALISVFREAIEADGRMLVGMCDPISTPPPLGPLFDLASSAGEAFEQLVSKESRRERLFPAILSELRSIPTCLFIEDIHWADEATFDLLRYLGRRVDRAPVLIVVTYRSEVVSLPLRTLLGDLSTAGRIIRMTVKPLSVQAVRAMAKDLIDDPDEIHRITGGNPFLSPRFWRPGIQVFQRLFATRSRRECTNWPQKRSRFSKQRRSPVLSPTSG
ncbi:MAG: AAA family ATPase [Thermomicrobiales bacterium]